MAKRGWAVLAGWVAVVMLAACGPTAETDGTATPEPTWPPADTPQQAGGDVPCAGRLAFLGEAGGETDIYVIQADGSGLANVTGGGGREQAFSWSPDGARIAFARHVGNADLYTIGADGSALVRLTETPSTEYSPLWAPDGRRVLFGFTQAYATELRVTGPEGGAVRSVTDSVAHKPDFAWSPDGSHIAFTMLDGYNQGDVYVMAVPDETGVPAPEGTNLTQHPAHDCCVAWAPDSERLLFLSSRSGERASLPREGRGNGIAYTDLRVHAALGGEGQNPAGMVRAVTTVEPEPPQGIYLVRRDGSGLTQLTNGGGRERQASWSPDGTRIAFVSNRDGNDEIYLLTLPEGTESPGGTLTRLTDSPERDWYPAWSPDGTCLAFESRRDGDWGLYVMAADGSGLTKLADSAGWGYGPRWAP
jgi:Tol biopolymer transport system component